MMDLTRCYKTQYFTFVLDRTPCRQSTHHSVDIEGAQKVGHVT